MKRLRAQPMVESAAVLDVRLQIPGAPPAVGPDAEVK
jgi:hypothetical protein